MTVTAIVAAGSNLGDRLRHLRRGIETLSRLEGVRIGRISSVWESAPVDSPAGAGDYLNLVCSLAASIDAESLLAQLHTIELKMGRRRQGRNAPRTLDLDLLFWSARHSRGTALSLPHPRWSSRSFVTAPLAEIGVGGWAPQAVARSGTEVRRRGALFSASSEDATR